MKNVRGIGHVHLSIKNQNLFIIVMNTTTIAAVAARYRYYLSTPILRRYCTA